MTIKNNHKYRPCLSRRVLSVLIIACLLFASISSDLAGIYAAGSEPVSFQVGKHVTAVLEDGILTLSGYGSTDDYTASDYPFREYSQVIHSLVIEDGITYIGDYLFYGLGQLGGTLILPGSITGFGDYAFSGDSPEDASHFTLIRNLFESGEITSADPSVSIPEESSVQPQDSSQQISMPEESSVQPQDSAADIQNSSYTDDSRNGSEETSRSESSQSPQEESSSSAEEAPPSVQPESAAGAGLLLADLSPFTGGLGLKAAFNMTSEGDISSPQALAGYHTETIFKQNIPHPQTLFFAGQSGSFICSAGNTSFFEAAQAAGFMPADGTVLVTLDDTAELELPVQNGRLTLPDCPEHIKSAHTGDTFFTYTFAGWRLGTDESLPVLAAGDLVEISGTSLSLYSAWNFSGSDFLKTSMSAEQAASVYTLIDSRTGTIPDFSGYVLSYQWQIAPQGDPSDAVWSDISGADGPEYRRKPDPVNSALQLRCQITASKQSRLRTLSEPLTLYSAPVNAAEEVQTVYVDQNAGSPAGDGTRENPLQTLDQAANKLRTSEAGGTTNTNRIVIIGTYQMESYDLLKDRPVPVTISGEPGAVLIGKQETIADFPLFLYDHFCLESITVQSLNHIYGNGHNITLGNNISNPNSSFYLYGSGRNSLVGGAIGEIAVYSGNITRIVGYVRSNSSLNVENKAANITVGGSAYVSTIVAGSASGSLQNANVKVNVTGGTVTTLLGGNQGYSNVASPFSGQTEIYISGGSVTNVLGAGTGRNASIPSYFGQLKIHVTGGEVGNIYGAGSAAFVISDAQVASEVAISVTGGTVNNIFAAGKGGDPGVNNTFENATYPFTQDPSLFGSLTGNASIMVGGDAVVGNVFASGEGYPAQIYDTTGNAYVSGNVTIDIAGGTVLGDVYGGGQGLSAAGYENCARVEADSQVKINISGGVIQGNVFGGGQTAKVLGSSSVTLSGGTVQSNVYGGGKQGLVEGSTTVSISGGTVYGSVYGGAQGSAGVILVHHGSVVNMTGGWVRGNLYGGSEQSDDGMAAANPPDLIFVNLTGGTVGGNVFGGGYRGTVNGSTHLHIGTHSLKECLYYQAHSAEAPALPLSALSIEGSVYAGGDFGGDEVNYDAITVKGTSHIYIDGTDYNLTSGSTMAISGGVFGSGASCDSGLTRLVTFKNYGQAIRGENGVINDASHSLTAVQRADRVLLINSHLRLTGQSDAANVNQTALYSLNRIGDHGENDALGPLGNGLVLQGGSTLILESATIELAKVRSTDSAGVDVIPDSLAAAPNTLLLDTGTVFRVSYTNANGQEIYGSVAGCVYMLAGESANAYAFARAKTASVNAGDGDFYDSLGAVLAYTNVPSASPDYRYWQIQGPSGHTALRHTVLTAEAQESAASDYAVAIASIELPPTDHGSTYTIRNVTLPSGTRLNLADAAMNGQDQAAKWVTTQDNAASGTPIDLEAQKSAISGAPLTTFGLFMRAGSGFSSADASAGKVISTSSSSPAGVNSVIGQSSTAVEGELVSPKIEFYLTYYNRGITASQDLGTVQIVLERTDGAGRVQETTVMNVQIMTRTTSLSGQTVDLYATPEGSYTGKLYIPAGASRSLQLTNVQTDANAQLVSSSAASLTGYQFSILMLPEKTQGWLSSSLMTDPYDLGGYEATSGAVSIGLTDSRYEAPVAFTLRNNPGFSAKDSPDTVTLILTDSAAGTSFDVRLRIHWQASVVSKVSTQAGRQYNALSGQSNPSVSQRSAVSAAYTLSGTNNVSDLWLELQDETGAKKKLPAGTKLTLLGLSDFFSYTVTGAEDQNKILLSGFTSMWGGSSLSGTLAPATLTVIIDFESASSALSVGEYSLRLRDEFGADSIGADFTLDNSGATVNLSASGGASRGRHTFTLTLSPGSDTRLSAGAAAVLTPDAGGFPEGAVFFYNEKEYYPVGGRIYIPLTGPGQHTVIMDTGNTPGLSVQEHTLSVRIFPTGGNSDVPESIENSVSYSVCSNPSYSLSVRPADTNARIGAAGTDMAFIVRYSAHNTNAANHQIQVRVQKKSGGQYTALSGWGVGGNTAFAGGSGEQTLSVQIPEAQEAGIYRLIFELGDQAVPLNIVVS